MECYASYHYLEISRAASSVVLPANARYRSLVREIERLSRALGHLRSECQNPHSAVIRSDNKVAVDEALGVALGGAKEILEGRTMSVDGVGWHTWAFDIVIRSLRRGEAKKLLIGIENLPVDETLNGLLYESLSEADNSPIIRRFNVMCTHYGKNLWRDFNTQTAVRLLMFWSYKAIRALRHVAESKRVPPAGYLDLLKAVWLLKKIKETPKVCPQIEETKAAVALVSTELLFMFKTLVKEVTYFPGYNSILALGNFWIFPDNFPNVEKYTITSTLTEANNHDHQTALEKAIMSSLSEVSSINRARSASSPSPQPPPYDSLDACCSPRSLPPSSLSPLLSSPTLIRRMTTKRKKQRPPTLKTTQQLESSLKTPPQSGRLPTPPSSAISLSSDTKSSRTASISEYSDTVENTESCSPRSSSPNINDLIDDIYCDSPTLGNEECFEKPVKIEPFTPSPVHTPRVPIITTPQSSPELSPEENITLKSSKRCSSIYSDQFYDPSIVAQKADEYGVRLGEKEIMVEEFGSMKLLASETCAPGSWKDSTFRVFQNELTGAYRFLTLHGNTVDQRNIPLQSAELVPNYAYSPAPIIYFRKTTTFAPKSRNTKHFLKIVSDSTPPPIASLYYKFHTLFDMFTFQTAFLHETVDADVQNVRSIRYTRGFRDCEHVAHGARVQLWKECDGVAPQRAESASSSVSTRSRKGSQAEKMRVRPTRLVLYLHEVAMCLFVTDDLTPSLIPTSPRTLRIRPSSHKAFSNPSTLKTLIAGTRDLSGGFRLDKDGLGIEAAETFEDVKWFEIEFGSDMECKTFYGDVVEALQQRRRERREVEGLRRAAERGVKIGALGGLSGGLGLIGGGREVVGLGSIGKGLQAPTLYS